MPGFQSTRLATEGALEPFLFLYTDDSIQGNPETCNQSSMMLNYEVKNTYIIVRLFPLPGRTCELKDLLLNEIFLNGFIGTPYVDGAHWYITVLLSAIVIIGILKKMRIENKAYIYLFWMTTVIIINKVGNEFSMLLGGDMPESYA